jgi:hypothetical protein
MAVEEAMAGLKERLDDFIKLALSGQTVQLDVKVYEKMVKQVSRSESTDDIEIETDMCLLMADFRPARGPERSPEMVTKVYGICPLNEIEIDAKTSRHIANERLRMDYARLKEAKIKFEQMYF